MRIALGLKSGQSGIRIRRVEPASPASKAQTKFEVYMVVFWFVKYDVESIFHDDLRLQDIEPVDGFDLQTFITLHLTSGCRARRFDAHVDMYCRFADLNATLKVLEAGDIVLKVQGSEIGDDGKVPFRGTALMSFRFFSHVGTSGHL